MRLPLIALALVVLLQAGCAAGFRAGGDKRGVGAGVAVGPEVPAQPTPPSSDAGGQRAWPAPQ
jgi:hypothetical protein